MKIQKTHFTRKSYIIAALFYFYALTVAFAGLCIDNASKTIKHSNPINSLARAMGFLPYNGSFQSWMLILCFALFVIVGSSAIIYEVRLAAYYENKKWSTKWGVIYFSTILGIAGIFLGIGYVAQSPYNPELISNSFGFLGSAVVTGTVVYIFLALLVLNISFLVCNFKNYNKPFKVISRTAGDKLLAEHEKEIYEAKKAIEQGNLAGTFGDNSKFQPAIPTVKIDNSTNTTTSMGKTLNSEKEAMLTEQKERIFPGLCTIDYRYTTAHPVKFDDNIQLDALAKQFRNYLAREEKLYFDLRTVRCFLAALSSSRLIILEGLSGTGKSSLARYFSEFLGQKSCFEAVQATWRDRTSLLGYYNDFSKKYNETEFLKRLYEASYNQSGINMMVLDECNISRIEYYFADFLSIMEYPEDEWKIKIMELPFDFEAPKHLKNGVLDIPENTFFIGTANKDDSTYTITDKVYDRAITISFDNRNIPFNVEEETKPISLSYSYLMTLYEVAQENEQYCLSSADKDKFAKITDFVYETFDLTYGNRIMVQIEKFVPVYVACGGTKEEALDFLFSRKILYKLEGRFEDYIKLGLNNLSDLLDEVYGKDEFELTKKEIKHLLRKL